MGVGVSVGVRLGVGPGVGAGIGVGVGDGVGVAAGGSVTTAPGVSVAAMTVGVARKTWAIAVAANLPATSAIALMFGVGDAGIRTCAADCVARAAVTAAWTLA